MFVYLSICEINKCKNIPMNYFYWKKLMLKTPFSFFVFTYNIFSGKNPQILKNKDANKKMKKRILCFLAAVIILMSLLGATVSAASATYKVIRGDTLWKISQRNEIGLDEIISANPQIKNPDLIYPNQIINVPLPDSNISSYEQQVIILINNIRVKNGLSKFKTNWELSRVAQYKSQDMHDKNYFSHTSPTYGSPFDMMKSFGISYRTAGENIAKGYTTPQAVVNGWMNSSGHRANILNPSFTQIGVGYVKGGNYWTQMFIG